MGKRLNFSNIQASHVVPIKESAPSRVRTGFEELVAHRTRPPFAYPALEDGVIQTVDNSAKVLVVKYNSGKKVCLNFGEEYTNNSANGFYVNQDVVINGFKKGDKVKKGDIITFNRQFFQADPDSKQVRWKIGVLAKVALLDNGGTIEDASILTQPLCDKMIFNPVHVKEIVITTDTNVREYAKVGTDILSTDPIIVFDQSPFDSGSEEDKELAALLSNLNQSAPRAGHTGTIVKIECLYKSAVSTMTNSLQRLIKESVAVKNAKAEIAASCENSSDFHKSQPLVATTKLGLVDLTPETVVLRFYIKQNKGMNAGDKLFFDSALKSVCSQVYPDYIIAEDGTKIEACSSSRGVLQRIITSPITSGLGNSVLEKLEQDILGMWENN